MSGKHFGEFVLMDYSEKTSTMRFNFGAITAVSIGGFLSQLGALRAALDGITLGTISKERWVGDETVLDNIPPSDSRAQRELKWEIHCENGCGGNYFGYTIACPDTDLATWVNTDYKGGKAQFADYTKPEIMAFITALETIAVDPVYGDDCVIVGDMFISGRSV